MDYQALAEAAFPFNVLQFNSEDESILHQVVRTGDVNLVRSFVNAGGIHFINKLDKKGRSPVHVAIEEKFDLIVELFLSVKEQIADNQYLLHHAIAKGNINIVKLLVQHFAVEAKNQENMTAFCTAVNEEKFEILDYLLSLYKNTDTSSTNYNVRALFYIAIIAGNIELVKQFLKSLFPINDSLERNPDGWRVLNDHVGFSPLHLAVKYLRLNIVEVFLSRGADISMDNETGSTALHNAFKAKTRGIWKTWQELDINDKIIDTILDVKLRNSAKLTNRDGISHLHVACSRDRPEVIERFLQDNSICENDFATCDDQGFSCLHFAAKYRCHKVAKILLRYGVNVNQRDDEYRTPLHIASKQTSAELVQLLMQHGADLTMKDCHSNTPVHLAFNDRNYAILDLLLTDQTIKNSNPTDTVGITHFHIACTRNDVSLVKAFLEIDVSAVNLQVPISDFKIRYSKYNKDLDWRGCAPLHFATAFNRAKVVELLLLRGADVHKKDAKGFRPIHLACQQNYDRFGDLIRETLQIWKIDSFVQTLEWMSVQMQNRPYSDVILVDEETKTSNTYPRRFTSSEDISNIFKTEMLDIVDWESHRIEQIKIIELLVVNGADLNAVDDFGNSPLYYICDFNIHKVLDVLNEKFHLDKRLGTMIVRGFLLEMNFRRKRLLQEIFKFGVAINIDESCYNYCSILHYICQENEFWDKGKADMVKYFLKKNACPDATNELMRRYSFFDMDINDYETRSNHREPQNRSTLLHIVTKYRPNRQNLEIINHLLEAKADVNAKQTDGMTALHNLSLHCGKTQEFQETIRTLLKYNARVDFRDNKGQTPLFLACLNQNSQMVTTLLHHGADVNIENHAGQTACCYFYENHIRPLRSAFPRKRVTLIITNNLVQYVQKMQTIGLHVSEKVKGSILKLDNYLRTVRVGVNHVEFEIDLKRQVEHLKKIKVSNTISFYDVIFVNEHFLSKKLILEQFKRILYSKESYIDTVPCYFHIINHKYNLAVERRRLLPKAKQTLNILLSTSCFPEVCSDMIFTYLTNIELIDFIKAFEHRTNFTTDNPKIKTYLKIRRVISKYVKLNAKNEFVIDLIVRRV